MRKKNLSVIFLLLVFGFEVLAQSSVLASTAEYRLQPALSEIKFSVRATVYTVKGKGAVVESQVMFDPESGEVKTPVQIEIPVNSLKTRNKLRDRDMRKMFEGTLYPSIIWKAEKMECGALNAEQFRTCNASGVLKMHGVEKEISIPVLIKVESTQVLAWGTLKVKREDYGLKAPSMLGVIRVSQDVTINFHSVWTAGGKNMP